MSAALLGAADLPGQRFDLRPYLVQYETLEPFASDSAIERLLLLVPSLGSIERSEFRAVREIRASFDTVPCPCSNGTKCRHSVYYRAQREITYDLGKVAGSLSERLGVPLAFTVLDNAAMGRFSGARKESVYKYGVRIGSVTIHGSASMALSFDDMPPERCDLPSGVHGSYDISLSDLNVATEGRVLGLRLSDLDGVPSVALVMGEPLLALLAHVFLSELGDQFDNLDGSLGGLQQQAVREFLLAASDRLAAMEMIDAEVLSWHWGAFILSSASTHFAVSNGTPQLKITHARYLPFDVSNEQHVLDMKVVNDGFRRLIGDLRDLAGSEPHAHRVSAGESLWELAAHYYGTGLLWRYLLGRNLHGRGDRESLYIGEEILVDRRWVMSARSRCGQVVLPGESLWLKAQVDSTGQPIRVVNPVWWGTAHGRSLVYPGEFVPWARELEPVCPTLGGRDSLSSTNP